MTLVFVFNSVGRVKETQIIGTSRIMYGDCLTTNDTKTTTATDFIVVFAQSSVSTGTANYCCSTIGGTNDPANRNDG